jgi:hypothetical protein
VVAVEQIVGREPRERVSHEAFVNQSWRYRAAASTPPLCRFALEKKYKPARDLPLTHDAPRACVLAKVDRRKRAALRVLVSGETLVARYNLGRHNNSLDVSRFSELLSDNLRVTQLPAATSTQPFGCCVDRRGATNQKFSLGPFSNFVALPNETIFRKLKTVNSHKIGETK